MDNVDYDVVQQKNVIQKSDRLLWETTLRMCNEVHVLLWNDPNYTYFDMMSAYLDSAYSQVGWQ